MSGGDFGGGAGGTTASPSEPRVAELKAAADHIERDIAEIRTIRSMPAAISGFYSALISVALGLAVIMAKGFHWV